MSNIINADNGSVSGVSGLKYTADSSGVLVLQTNGTTALTIDTSQNVTFAGTVSFASGSFTNLSYTGTLTGGTGVVNLGSGQFYKDASGNVGVGTSSPQSKFAVSVSAGASTTQNLIGMYQMAGADAVKLRIGGYRYDNAAQTYIDFIQNSGTNFQSQITFNTNSGGGVSEAMRIDSSGNVGIGTSSPVSKFDVNGCIRSIANTTPSSGSGIELVYNPGDSSYISSYNRTSSAYLNLTLSALNTIFTNNGAERMRIDSSGNLLVGTTNSSVSSGSGFRVFPTGEIASTLTASTSAAVTLTAFSSGAGTYRFYVDMGGTVHATSTSISAISDSSLKENIKDLETGLAEVMALKPRRFDWKNGDATNVAGFIAQEVAEILPELVEDSLYTKDKDGNDVYKKNLKMGDILPTLVKAIQELNAKVEALEAQLAAK